MSLLKMIKKKQKYSCLIIKKRTYELASLKHEKITKLELTELIRYDQRYPCPALYSF